MSAATGVDATALGRVVRRSRRTSAQRETCDLCAAPLAAQHRHLLDTEKREVVCTCRPCSLLFEQSDSASANGRHYRLVPSGRLRLAPVATAALGVPVGLAFFVRHTDGVVVAHYPSPVGATEWEVDPLAWHEVVAASPALGQLRPDVEALLVNTARNAAEYWLVPIDDCFRLVALVRQEWRGWSGGPAVWQKIEHFFSSLEAEPRMSGGSHG